MGIFFILPALGKGGKPINVCKFRTMIPDADSLYDDLALKNGLDELGKIKDDPRITKIGRLMRRYWLDEVPQIFTNLLHGDISLVGIRARGERDWNYFPSEHKERSLRYRPGLMGIGYLAEGETLPDLVECEKGYLDEKQERPFITDAKYFFKLSYGIFFGGIRGR